MFNNVVQNIQHFFVNYLVNPFRNLIGRLTCRNGSKKVRPLRGAIKPTPTPLPQNVTTTSIPPKPLAQQVTQGASTPTATKTDEVGAQIINPNVAPPPDESANNEPPTKTIVTPQENQSKRTKRKSTFCTLRRVKINLKKEGEKGSPEHKASAKPTDQNPANPPEVPIENQIRKATALLQGEVSSTDTEQATQESFDTQVQKATLNPPVKTTLELPPLPAYNVPPPKTAKSSQKEEASQKKVEAPQKKVEASKNTAQPRPVSDFAANKAMLGAAFGGGTIRMPGDAPPTTVPKHNAGHSQARTSQYQETNTDISGAFDETSKKQKKSALKGQKKTDDLSEIEPEILTSITKNRPTQKGKRPPTVKKRPKKKQESVSTLFSNGSAKEVSQKTTSVPLKATEPSPKSTASKEDPKKELPIPPTKTFSNIGAPPPPLVRKGENSGDNTVVKKAISFYQTTDPAFLLKTFRNAKSLDNYEYINTFIDMDNFLELNKEKVVSTITESELVELDQLIQAYLKDIYPYKVPKSPKVRPTPPPRSTALKISNEGNNGAPIVQESRPSEVQESRPSEQPVPLKAAEKLVATPIPAKKSTGIPAKKSTASPDKTQSSVTKETRVPAKLSNKPPVPTMGKRTVTSQTPPNGERSNVTSPSRQKASTPVPGKMTGAAVKNVSKPSSSQAFVLDA